MTRALFSSALLISGAILCLGTDFFGGIGLGCILLAFLSFWGPAFLSLLREKTKGNAKSE